MLNGELDIVILAGADEIDMAKLDKAFVIYIGSHGDAGAARADVVLPGAAYTEKSATYVNTEGRPQMAFRAAFPPGDAREDWAITVALAKQAGADLGFASLGALRAAMYKVAPQLMQLDHCQPTDANALNELQRGVGKTSKDAFVSPVKDFYLTNPIARASAIMAECSALKNGQKLEAAE